MDQSNHESLAVFEPLMKRAIELAESGRGFVEPNPMVGCVIQKDGQVIGEGFHEQFGGPHAEVNALANCSEDPRGATAIVSLEPCCHHGKTPPCSDALIQAGIGKVVVGLRDPNPSVDGDGIEQLLNAGIPVTSGLLSAQVARQNAGFVKRIKTGKPWVIAKYAMTMDGNLATRTGDSKWISNETCRNQVHLLRSQIDAIIVGSETVRKDNPQLTARPVESLHNGPRSPSRIVLDSAATLATDANLVTSSREIPTLVVAHPAKSQPAKIEELRAHGVEVLFVESDYRSRLDFLLKELGKREMTNVIVEGGSGVLGEFLQAGEIDEINLYLAPKLLGSGLQPFRFPELASIREAQELTMEHVEELDGNLYVRGLINHEILDQA